MTDFRQCVSKDGFGLRYPNFSLVFLQIFALESIKDFKASPEAISRGFMKEIDNGIDTLIFNMGERGAENIMRYSLGGFDFFLEVENPYSVTLSGHILVEASVFFGSTVSISYRFIFDNLPEHCSMSEPVATDHIITLLATHLCAEHWSSNTFDSETDINFMVKDLKISGLMLDCNGKLLDEGEKLCLTGAGRVFDNLSVRYKRFIRSYCCSYKKNVTKKTLRMYAKSIGTHMIDSMDDMHYAMVDIWESISHPMGKKDLFSPTHKEGLSEPDILSHIRDFHKPELIGLMTLYPEEWPYRDAEAYDDICGENIAIDTDDLVLVNSNVCVVLGTYGRRRNWAVHLAERVKYHVSWPEYLLILEMVLAKKYVISYSKDLLIDSTLGLAGSNPSEIIARNAFLSVRLTRLELQMDVVKYSRFISHKVMFDRTIRRLEIDKDEENLRNLMGSVDSSLHNLSDYKAMKSDVVLNFILVLISVASTFELFFQKTEMPFLTFFNIKSGSFSAVLVFVVAMVTFFGILLVLVNMVKKLWTVVKEHFTTL